MNKISATIEDYLSIIYVLDRDREPIVGARIAELLGVTPPTVTNTLKRMMRDGLITMNKKGVRLTKPGLDSARTITRRHMLTEWMMVKRLPWSKLHQEAHHLEHAISSDAENALWEELGHPHTCPHGNPLPGYENETTTWIPLTRVSAKEKVVIRRIHELAEQNVALMEFLEKQGITPGTVVTVNEVLSFNETISVQIKKRDTSLGFAAARYIYVEHEE
jgi:DtxR family Mn-dependent transcriptional regulator